MFRIRVISIFLSLLLQSLPAFSQKELKAAMDVRKIRQQAQRDSISKLITHAPNDTIRANLYFELFESSGSVEWKGYEGLLKMIDSVLKIETISPVVRKALLNKKATANRYGYFYYYDCVDGPGSKKGQALLEEAIRIFKETGNFTDLAQIYVQLADDYFKQAKLFDQLRVLQTALKYMEQNKTNRGISRFYVQLQLFYANVGDTVQSLSYIDKALDLEKVIHDSTRLARGYYLAGLTYSKLQKHDKAIEFLELSAKTFEERPHMQQRDRIVQSYLLLGDEYRIVKKYEDALHSYDKTIAHANVYDDFVNIFRASLAKGKILSLQGKHKDAIKLHEGLLKLVEEAGEVYSQPGRMCFMELAQDHYRKGSYPEARKYMDKALVIVAKEGVVVDIYEYEKIAYQIDSAANYFEGAYKHYYRCNTLKAELNKDEVVKQSAKERFQSELELQQVSFTVEREKKEMQSRAERRKQNLIILFVIGGLILVSAFSIFIFRSLRITRKQKDIIEIQKKEVEEQKHLVEEKQKEITDSIAYAKRLQEAILPPQEFINRYLPNNFIVYKPKDIVAGDFYWAEKSDDRFFIAAADSTGHGVPGAMVSVVCSNALNRAVKEFKLNEPGKILDKTRKLVVETFEKSVSEVKDGMDISLLCVDHKNKKVFWAGANNPLWYVEDGELKEIKANKQPIGNSDHDTPFTTHSIEYKQNTTFYLFTDGLADQFGGPNGKKFKYKQFSELLLQYSTMKHVQQAAVIEKAFLDWKGELEQVDDVCVIGITL